MTRQRYQIGGSYLLLLLLLVTRHSSLPSPVFCIPSPVSYLVTDLIMTPQESLSFPRRKTSADIASGENVCPVCSREAREEFVSLRTLPKGLDKLVRANAPDIKGFGAICARCVRLFRRAKDHIIKDAAMQKDGSHVLSTPLRIDVFE